MSTRSYIITSAAMVLLLIAILYALDHYGKNSRVFGRAGNIDDPAVVKLVVNTPQEAYYEWKRLGFRGRTIVFVSDKWERLDLSGFADVPLSRPYPLKLYKIAVVKEQGGLTSANLLFIASLNGIIRRIVAILSPQGFSQMLEAAPSAKERKISDSEIYLPHQGFPRWFTTGTHFRGAHEPVLIYVSASYFRTAGPEELYRQLKASGLMTDSIILCKGAEGSGITGAELDRLYQFSRLIGMPVMSGADRRSGPAIPH